MPRFNSSVGSLPAAVDVAADVANGLNQRDIVAAITTANPTLLAAQVVNTIRSFSGQTAAQTVTLPAASALLALIPNVQVGQTFDFTVQNGHTTSGTITLAGGTGVTVTNTFATAAQPIASTRTYRGVVTNVASPAVTIFPIAQVA